MGSILKALGWLFAWIVAGAAIFLTIIWFMAYDPEQVEPLTVVGKAEKLKSDTLKIVSWNIGYAGLGDDMDFFYDGGQSVQTSKGRTMVNLDSITRFLASHRDADFVLIQEADLKSKRSYEINEYDSLLVALGSEFSGYVGLNYVSPYVPYPFYSTIGAVRGGVATFSRHTPSKATRYAYPGGFSWPVSMFNLKRCLLVVEIPLSDSSTLYVANTHNTAYDTGNMRSGEMEFLKKMFTAAPYFVVAGDWNSNPTGYKASNAEIENEYFSPMAIEKGTFPDDWSMAYDKETQTARYGYEPYNAATTTRTTIDFAVSGAKVEILEAKCVDLGFRNSDHNPVIYKIVIRR